MVINEQVAVNLVEELSEARIAFAQAIINYERVWECLSLDSIAASWLALAAKMQEREWEAGRDALLHYLRLQKSKSALKAIKVLTSSESSYSRNAKLFTCIHRQRKFKPDEAYREASNRLIGERLGRQEEPLKPALHGRTTGANTFFGKFIKAWKSIFSREYICH